MIEETGRRSKSAAALRALALLILVMLAATVIVGQQRGSGAYLAELSATDANEARHFVTGLMVADWAAAGFGRASDFAADYALHFPPVEPLSRLSLYHLAEGAWFGLLGFGTPAALLLPALLAALLVVSTGWAATTGAGVLAGVAAGFVLSALPLLREATIVIGLELPLALLSLFAALAFARYVRRGTVVDALLFCACAAACILTAPAGAVVGLLPVLVVGLAGRFALLRRASFWVPLVLLAVLAGLRSPSWPMVVDMAALRGVVVLRGDWAALAASLGPVPLVLAGFGVLFAIWAGWRRQDADEGVADEVTAGETMAGETMAAVTALALAWGAALALGLASGPLAVLPLLAPAVMLAAFGAMRLFGLITSGWTIVAGLIVALVLLLSAMPALLEPVRKGVIGMDDAAQAFLARDATPPVVVVAADAKGEAALAAAVAQRDRARRSFVVPAATLRTGDAAALLTVLDAVGASALAVETTPAAQALVPNRAVSAAVAAAPDRFRLLGTFPRADGAGEVRLYAILGRSQPAADPAAVLRRLRAAPAS